MDLTGLLYAAASKIVLYGAALLALGVGVTRTALWGLALRSSGSLQPDSFERSLRRAAQRAAFLLLGALAVRAWAYTAGAFGLSEAFLWENVRLVALESRWGEAWRLQVYVGVALLLAARVIGRLPRTGWLLYTLAAALVCAALPLVGHASGSFWRLVLHAGHLLAAGVWLGSLSALVVLRSARVATAKRAEPADPTDEFIRHFSSVALPAAAVVVSTGAVAAWLYVGSPMNLVASAYGQALLVKLLAFSPVVGCGWANWRRARAGYAPSAPLLYAEVASAALVLAATSVLTELEQP
jgi:putative copper resistance protein D